jgi:hypothetical protein
MTGKELTLQCRWEILVGNSGIHKLSSLNAKRIYTNY